MINYLTQEEVNKLPSGTKVNIKWYGGNGPYMYIIKHINEITYTLDSHGVIMKDALDFVGLTKPFTKVWL